MDIVIFDVVLALALVQFVGVFVLVVLAANMDADYPVVNVSAWRKLVLRLKGVNVREQVVADPVAYSGGVVREGEPDFIEWQFDDDGDAYMLTSQDVTYPRFSNPYVSTATQNAVLREIHELHKPEPDYSDPDVAREALRELEEREAASSHVDAQFDELNDCLEYSCKYCCAPLRPDGLFDMHADVEVH